MLKYISKIKLSGEVFSLRLPQGANNIPEGPTEDGLTVVYIDFDIDNRPLFIETHYYNFETSSFAVRERRPNPAAKWQDGQWVWNHEDFLNFVRKERASRIYQTDWVMFPDNNLLPEKKAEAIHYRQKLRDITDNCEGISKLEDVPWPIKPSFL